MVSWMKGANVSAVQSIITMPGPESLAIAWGSAARRDMASRQAASPASERSQGKPV